ncbi:hypothetical protein ACHAQH_005011 [Verticillium albo-atrum]
MRAAPSYLYRHLKAILAIIRRFLGQPSSRQLTKSSTNRHKRPFASHIPPGAWDSHMHILDPQAYPLSPKALYRPSTHTLTQALGFEASLSLDNIVLVQPSIYADDNACLLDALRTLGPKRGRGVVAFEPGTVNQETLREWHDLGVRGVRINLASVGASLSAKELESLLQRFAAEISSLGWVIQLYMPMEMLPILEPIVPSLGLRVCIDHMGCPPVGGSSSPYDIPGFRALADLIRGGSTFVKLSAPYRLGERADFADLEPVERELLRLGGMDRVVFATDWPHTRFEGLDIGPWVEQVLDLCGGDERLVERLFRGNAEDLWGVEHGSTNS